MTVKEFRHNHLLKMINEAGTIEALAAKTGMNPQYISQLKNRTRGIGDRTARKLEAATGLTEGTMDRPVSGQDLDQELAYLLSALPEKMAVQAMVNALPQLSTDGVRALAAALLAQLIDQPEPSE